MTPGFKIRRRKDGRQAKLTRNQSAEEDGEGGLPRGLDTFCFFAAGVKPSVSIQHGESRRSTRWGLFGGRSNRLEDMINKIGNDNIHDWIGNSDVQCIHWTFSLSLSLSPMTSTNVGVERGGKSRFGGEDASTTRTTLAFHCFNWSLLLLLLLKRIHYYYIQVSKRSNNSRLYTNCIQWESSGGEY